MSCNSENITLVITPFIPELNDFDETFNGDFEDDEEDNDNDVKHENASLQFTLGHFNSRNWNKEINELHEFAKKERKAHCYNVDFPSVFLYNESNNYHIKIKGIGKNNFQISLGQWDNNYDLVYEYDQEGLSKNQVEKIIQLFYSNSYSQINKIRGTLPEPELQLFLKQRNDKKNKRETRWSERSIIAYLVIGFCIFMALRQCYKLFFE